LTSLVNSIDINGISNSRVTIESRISMVFGFGSIFNVFNFAASC
jgi:hypothetical protein